MKNFGAIICLSAAMGYLAASSAVAAAGDPDPNTELHAISDSLAVSAQTANDAIAIAASDPVKACQMARTASASVVDAKTRLQALSGRLADATPLGPFKAKLAAGVVQFQQLADSVCSGQIAKAQSDPQTQAITARIGGYVKTYTDDTLAAYAAKNKGDTATFCRLTTDGKSQLDGLTDYLVGLRKTTQFTPELSAGLDQFNEKILGFKSENDQRMVACRP